MGRRHAWVLALGAWTIAGWSCTGATAGTGGMGTSSSSTGHGGGSVACATSADCPAPSSACAVATCLAGTCGTQNVPMGAMKTPDVPGDCHDTTCDGMGHVSQVIDTTDLPQSTNPCLVGTCDALGNPGTSPVAAGMPCNMSAGGVCDGSGQCVPCLKNGDCPTGETCSAAHLCLMASCTNGVKDGNETDVDCGGGPFMGMAACPPCAAGKKCDVGSDCASSMCTGGICQ